MKWSLATRTTQWRTDDYPKWTGPYLYISVYSVHYVSTGSRALSWLYSTMKTEKGNQGNGETAAWNFEQEIERHDSITPAEQQNSRTEMEVDFTWNDANKPVLFPASPQQCAFRQLKRHGSLLTCISLSSTVLPDTADIYRTQPIIPD